MALWAVIRANKEIKSPFNCKGLLLFLLFFVLNWIAVLEAIYRGVSIGETAIASRCNGWMTFWYFDTCTCGH